MNSTGWCDYLKAVETRNRITHPKNAESFHVEDSAFNEVERAKDWHADAVEELLKHCGFSESE